MKRFALSLLSICILNAHTQANAQEYNTEVGSETAKSELDFRYDMGIGLLEQTGLTRNLDDDFGLAIFASAGFYYGDFYIELSPFRPDPFSIGYTLQESDTHQLNLIGISWFSEISEAENEIADLKTRMDSFEVGLEYIKLFDNSDLRVKFVYDVEDQHNGFIFSADYSHALYANDWTIQPSLGINYLSEKASDFFYGVDSEEANPQLPFYKADAGLGVTARLYAEHPLGTDKTFFTFASYSHYSSDITDSPIVTEKHGNYTIAMGVLWHF